MQEPFISLSNGTRVRTTDRATHTPEAELGLLVSPKHLETRKPLTAGVICGWVAGHGGDVYWVAHLGAPCTAVRRPWEHRTTMRYPEALEEALKGLSTARVALRDNRPAWEEFGSRLMSLISDMEAEWSAAGGPPVTVCRNCNHDMFRGRHAHGKDCWCGCTKPDPTGKVSP